MIRQAASSGADVQKHAAKPNRRNRTVRAEAAKAATISLRNADDANADNVSNRDLDFQKHATARLHKWVFMFDLVKCAD